MNEKDFEYYTQKADIILVLHYQVTASGVFSQVAHSMKPIITWNLPFFKEYEEKYGACITVNSIDELEKKIIEVSKSKKIKEDLRRGVKKLLESGSWANTAKKHWKLYQSL